MDKIQVPSFLESFGAEGLTPGGVGSVLLAGSAGVDKLGGGGGC